MNRGIQNKKYQSRVTISLAIVALAIPFSAHSSADRMKVLEVCKKERQQAGGVNENLCAAAKDNLSAKNANTSVAAIHAGITTVCSAACASVYGEGVCQYSTMAGAAGVSVVEKDFMAALTPAGEKGLAAATKKTATETGVDAAKDKATEASSGANMGACLTAAQSAKKSYEKFSDSSKNKKGIEELVNNSAQLDNAPGTQAPNIDTGSVTVTDQRFQQSAMTAGILPSAGSLCSEESIQTATGALACAARHDPSLPPEVTSGRFLKDLEKVTGKSADQFFGEFNNPGQSIMNGVGGRLPAKNQELLAQNLMAMSKNAGQYMGSTGTQVSGMSKKSQISLGSSDEFDPLASMNQMMAQLMGGKKEDQEANLSSNELIAGNNYREPASISPENKAVSLFDRVQWRYGSLIQKQHLGGATR
jgi:hypothetical protein